MNGCPAVDQRAPDTAGAIDASRYVEALRSSAIGMALLADDGKCLVANPAMCATLGRREDELQSAGLEAGLSPEEQEAWRRRFQEIITGRCRTAEFEQRCADRGGGPRWLRIHLTRLDGSRGHAPLVLAQVDDVSPQRAVVDSLQESEQRFRQLTESIDEAFWIAGPDGRLLYASPGFETIWGRPRAALQVEPARFVEAVHPEDRTALAEHLAEADRERPYAVEYRIVRPDGQARWILDRAFPVLDATGQPHRFAGVAEDVTERHLREERLRELQLAVEQSPVAVVITDVAGNIEFVNPKFTEMTGYSCEEVVDQNLRILKSGIHDESFYRALWETITAGRAWHGEMCNKRKDGALYWESASISGVRNARGQVTHYVAVKEDITDRKAAELRIQQMAYRDSLTGLANRAALQERAEWAVDAARRNGHQVAVHYIDLDRFKVVNDTLGHAAGDALLAEVAARLRRCLAAGDTAARLGGDEFAIVQAGGVDQTRAAALARSVLTAMAAPFSVAGQELHISPSIGVSLFPADSGEWRQLLQNADMAMYQAKKAGRNNFQFFTAELCEEARDRLELERDLHVALRSQQLLLHFQPQFDLSTRRLTGIEALVRWQHPRRGFVVPNQFIPVAEECGLIGPLSDWVLRQACRQNAAWQAAGLPRCRMAVNVSPADFKHGYICDKVAAALRESGLDSEYLELEVTESMLLQDEQMLECVPRLKELGVALSIDDFGTGYSSLNYLRRLPVHKLKIDQSFVRGLPASNDDAIIAGAIVELGHALGLTVIAEGIENPEQLRALRALTCDQGQGYHLGPPMSAAALEAVLCREQRRLRRPRVASRPGR